MPANNVGEEEKWRPYPLRSKKYPSSNVSIPGGLKKDASKEFSLLKSKL